MTDLGAQSQPPAPATAAGEAEPSQRSPAAEQRVHLYEAVSARRDQVLNQFAGQRAAILKAVADQRAAAVAPILAVQAKQANEHPANAPPTHKPRTDEPAAAANLDPAMTAAATSPPPTNAMIGGAIQRRSLMQFRRSVAADIVSTIRALVAAEVRAQLAAAEPAAKPAAESGRTALGANEAAGEGARR